MRKLKLQMQVSIDGFIAGPNGEMDWLVWDWDEEIKNNVNELTKPVDTILLGRVLAQGFIPHWTAAAANPETSDEFSRKMTDAPKFVFTNTLHDVGDWKATQLVKGDLQQEVMAIKQIDGNDIIVYGGGRFVSALIRHNLIDEYNLFVNPTAIGKGMSIFGQIDQYLKLRLRTALSFPCGIVKYTYDATAK